MPAGKPHLVLSAYWSHGTVTEAETASRPGEVPGTSVVVTFSAEHVEQEGFRAALARFGVRKAAYWGWRVGELRRV